MPSRTAGDDLARFDVVDATLVEPSRPPCSAGVADLARNLDLDLDSGVGAATPRGRVAGEVPDPAAGAADVAVVLQALMTDVRVPAHRRRLVAAILNGVRDGQLGGGDCAGPDGQGER